MSELAKRLFDELRNVKDAVQSAAPGLKNLVPEVKAELSRLGTQGAMELASALFGNSAFVPYGPGQYTPDPATNDAATSHEQEHAHEHSHEQDGMGR